MHKPHLFARAVFIVALAVAFAVGATFLPDNPYQRWQLLEGTVYAKGQWIYERLHFDKRDIDVAILGDSRTLIGLQPDRIAADLAAAGKPSSVANLSLVGEGRNIQWVIARDLMRTKHPKVLVFTVSSDASPWGHESFRYFAPAKDVWSEAGYGLYNTRKDLTYLPFRQMKLFAARLFPDVFHLRAEFDPAAYSPAQDNWTAPRTSADGKFNDPTRRVPREELLDQWRKSKSEVGRHSSLPELVRRITDRDDRLYMDMIAAEAAKRGVKIMFVSISDFHRHDGIKARAYYQSIGVIQENPDIAERDDLYMDVHHTNMYGSQLVSDRVAEVLAGMLPDVNTAPPQEATAPATSEH